MFIALGSNKGNSLRILSEGVKKIDQRIGKVLDCSNLYKSKAVLYENQDDFYNGVIKVERKSCWGLDRMHDLLGELQKIELECGTKKEFRYGPRVLDLDIIGFENGDHFKSEILQIPHERAMERDFVLFPLRELDGGKELFNASINIENTLVPVVNEIWNNNKAKDEQNKMMIMGILNVTPDSFSDGGQYNSVDKAVNHGLEMIQHGVDVIDIGGESTRPNARFVSTEEELERVIPVIKALREQAPDCIMSIDTRKDIVAREAIKAGVNILNDPVGEIDDEKEKMLKVAGELLCPIITMHSVGNAQTMESLIKDDNSVDIVDEVGTWLRNRVQNGIQNHNICRWNMMVDPGLGFGKTNEQSLKLLQNIQQLRKSHSAILIGASRKRFVREYSQFDKVGDITTNTTTVLSKLQGATMVRVHNVPQTVDTIKILE